MFAPLKQLDTKMPLKIRKKLKKLIKRPKFSNLTRPHLSHLLSRLHSRPSRPLKDFTKIAVKLLESECLPCNRLHHSNRCRSVALSSKDTRRSHSLNKPVPLHLHRQQNSIRLDHLVELCDAFNSH